MTVAATERKAVLVNLVRVASSELHTLWNYAATSNQDFPSFFKEAFPELVDPFAATAAELSTAWYDETPSETDYFAVPGPLPVLEALQKSVEWALGANGDKALKRLEGTLQRTVLTTARDTTVTNVYNEGNGARWARHASPDACAFCALLATRDTLYTSEESATRVTGRRPEITEGDRRKIASGYMTRDEAYARREKYVSARQAKKYGLSVGDTKIRHTRGTQELGDKYHDNCNCIAVEVRPGGMYQPPEYVDKWEQAYIDATLDTPGKGEYGAIDINAVLAHMRESLGTH